MWGHGVLRLHLVRCHGSLNFQYGKPKKSQAGEKSMKKPCILDWGLLKGAKHRSLMSFPVWLISNGGKKNPKPKVERHDIWFTFIFFFIWPAKTSRSTNVTFKASILLTLFFSGGGGYIQNMMVLVTGFRGDLFKQNFGWVNKHILWICTWRAAGRNWIKETLLRISKSEATKVIAMLVK